MPNNTNDNLLGLTGMENTAEAGAKTAAAKKAKAEVEVPANFGKAWNDCEVPDFNDPNRPKTCLEVDFPIAQINALSQPEATSGAAKNLSTLCRSGGQDGVAVYSVPC